MRHDCNKSCHHASQNGSCHCIQLDTWGTNTLCNRLHVTLSLERNRGDIFRVTSVSLRCNRRGCFCQHDTGSSEGEASGASEASLQLWLNKTQTFSASAGGERPLIRCDKHGDDNREDDWSLRGRSFGDENASGGWRLEGEEGRDGRLFECCHYVKASPGCPCTLTPVAESWRPRPSGRSVCLLLLKGSVSRIQARVRGLATCPKSKL